MGHLVYRRAENELQHIGGFNSYGANYQHKIGDSFWEPLQSSHSNVTNESELELTQNASIYFP
jgi:hypothetical protein